MQQPAQFAATLSALPADRDTDGGMSLTRALERLEKAVAIHGEHLGRVRELADIPPEPQRGQTVKAEPVPDLAYKLIRQVADLAEQVDAQTASLQAVGQCVERLR